MMIIRQMWADLNTPQDFKFDWYGGATNQMAHTLLGMVITVLALCVGREVFGEMPYRWQVGFCLLIPYTVLIEGFFQGWRGRDSLADTWFYMLGVLGTLLPFKELSVTTESTVVIFNHIVMLKLLSVWAVSLVGYSYVRARRQYLERPGEWHGF